MQLVGGLDLAEQMQKALENVGHALAAADASPADVVRIMTFVVDYRPEYAEVLGRVTAGFFGADNLPAATLIGVSALAMPEFLVEIQATAVVDE